MWTCTFSFKKSSGEKEMTRIALIAAAAMLLSAGTANAQSSTSGANQGRCWDSATNQVRDMSSTSGTSSSTGSSGSLSGSSGSAGSGTSSGAGGSASSSTMGSGASTAATRPAGMVDCR